MIVSQDHNLTNQLLIDELDLWELFDSKSIDDDKTKRYYQLIDDLLDSQIGESVAWLQSDEAKDYFFQQVELEKEIFDALEDSWDEIFESSYEKVDDLLDAIYDEGKKQGYSNIKETLNYTDADIQAIRLAKDYNYDLIKSLTGDLQSTVKNKILQGIIMGENPYNLSRTLVKAGVQPLDGSNFTPRQRATMIAKTETSRMQNTGMIQSYLNEGYTQVKILTAEDDHVCSTCLYYAYHYDTDKKLTFEGRGEERVHNIVDLIKGGKFPPFHPLCRCTYLTVWETKQDKPSNPPIINLTPLSVKVRKSEEELPIPTPAQLKKNLRPGEREKYNSYQRNIVLQREWLKENPNAPIEEIAKHQKRLAFLEKRFNELKKKALGVDAHPQPKPEPKPEPEPKKEKPKPEPKPEPEPEPLPEVKYDEKVSDLKKDLPLSDDALDEVLKWSNKKVKNQSRYGYEFNPETGELIGKEIRGRQGVIQFRDFYSDRKVNTVRTISNSENQTFPSATDVKYSRALSGEDHIIVSNKELWYIRTPEKLDLHTVNHGQYEVDVVFKKAELAATKKVIEAKAQNIIDDKQLKELYDKTYGDTLLSEFNTREWRDRGFSIRRGYREDYKEPRKRKTKNTQPQSKQSRPTSELTYDNLKTPEDVAAFYGLDYERGTDSKGRPTQKFTDHLSYTDAKTGKTINHDIDITFDAYFTKNTGAKKYIDSTNSGKCTYDLKEIIKMYKESPEIYKFATRGIDFVNENKRRTLGYTRWSDKRVRVLPNSFNRNQTERGNVRQTMYHEMSHCLDFSLTKKELVDILKNPTNYSSREVWDARERLNRREYGISSTDEWKEIVKKEEKWLSDNGYNVEHCSWYGDGWRNIDVSENWAETGSMAGMDDLTDKSQATMQRSKGWGYEFVPWDEWIKLHKITYDWAVAKWRSLKPTDFTYI